MLLSYSFSNFQSFVEPAEISFVLTQRDVAEGWVRTSGAGRRVATAMAVMGANGAGKSGVIRVGGLLSWFMSESFSLPPEDALPFRPHMAHLDAPSTFKVAYEGSDGAEWSYELRIHANRIGLESLTRKGSEPGSRPSRIFTREARGDGYAVSQSLGLADSEAAKVRPNVSLISWARQYGSDMAQRITKVPLVTNVDRWGREPSTASAQLAAAAYFEKHSNHRDSMRSLMKQWDFGLSDVRLQSLPARPTAGGDPGEAEWIPVGIHRAGDQTFELPFWHESSGTQRAFVLLWKLLPVLEHGGIALIDELEADLHPHMIEPLLRLFHSEASNPHGAQIVFTCHSPEVLRSFHRAQVTFVEKVECKSQAYRGDAIEGLTNQHNLYNKYLSGALGAVPQV